VTVVAIVAVVLMISLMVSVWAYPIVSPRPTAVLSVIGPSNSSDNQSWIGGSGLHCSIVSGNLSCTNSQGVTVCWGPWPQANETVANQQCPPPSGTPPPDSPS
jgi:hypothetical protein